jgi:hypothetical protein
MKGVNSTDQNVCTFINCSEEKFKYYRENLNCPEDSVIKQTDDMEEHCCQLTAKCTCSKCDKKPTKSWCKMAGGSNFEPVLVKKSENVPGRCCDIYICRKYLFSCGVMNDEPS